MALLAAYNFDDISSGIIDQADGHDITTLGTSQSATGHTGNGLQVASAGIAGNGPVLTSPDWAQTSNRTLMCWVQTPDANPSGYPVELHVSSINSGAWGLLLDGQGNMSVQARNSSGFSRATGPYPGDGLWHHWAGTYDGSTIRLYQDGVLAASQTMTGPLRTDADVLWMWDGGQASYTLDDVRIFDEALDQASIQSYMNTPVVGNQHSQASVSFSLGLGLDVSGFQPDADEVDEGVTVSLEVSGVKHASASIDLPLSLGMTTSESLPADVWFRMGGTVGAMDVYGGQITEGV